jgi:hypothetical protein
LSIISGNKDCHNILNNFARVKEIKLDDIEIISIVLKNMVVEHIDPRDANLRNEMIG